MLAHKKLITFCLIYNLLQPNYIFGGSYTLHFINNTSRPLPLTIKVISSKGGAHLIKYIIKYSENFNKNLIRPWSSGHVKIFSGSILIFADPVTKLCFKDVYTIWDGKKIGLMRYHRKSPKVSGCEDIYAILEERPGGKWHRMVWSKLDPNHKHYNDYLNKHRAEMNRKKAALEQAIGQKQAKIDHCIALLRGKSDQAAIKKLQDDIKETEKTIANWKKREQELGLSKDDQKRYTHQQAILKKQQERLKIAIEGEKMYAEEKCEEIIGKKY